MPSTVLIISNEDDSHTDAVVLELNKRNVPVIRFHPEDFPHACNISVEIQDGEILGEIATSSRTVALKDIGATWYRRPKKRFPEVRSTSGTSLDGYVQSQTTVTLRTLYHCLQAFWVCDPYKLQRAEIKALQLAEASKAGLKTPHTLVTNQPAKASTFINQLGDCECAIKALRADAVRNEEGYRFPLTTTLPNDYPLDAVAITPTIFQPYVCKATELRCVVIGEKVFTAKINSQTTARTSKDWRGGPAQWEPFSLPKQVEASLLRLTDSFGINFASLDMILTPEGEFVFLDLNPNGAWLWLEVELGLPLAANMADLLISHLH